MAVYEEDGAAVRLSTNAADLAAYTDASDPDDATVSQYCFGLASLGTGLAIASAAGLGPLSVVSVGSLGVGTLGVVTLLTVPAVSRYAGRST